MSRVRRFQHCSRGSLVFQFPLLKQVVNAKIEPAVVTQSKCAENSWPVERSMFVDHCSVCAFNGGNVLGRVSNTF